MKLEINGKEADYKGKIAITRQFFNADDLSLRLIDITNRFVLPNSDKNKEIINGASRLESNALDILYDAKVIDSFFLFNGMGIFTEAGNEKKFQLVDQSKVFFDDLKGKLQELDLESEDIVYDLSTYNSLKNLNSSIWVWPIVQMHENEPPDDLKYLRPHFSYYQLLVRIFQSRGWSFDFDTDFIQNLALQANSEDFKFTSYQKTLNGTGIGNLTVNDFSHDVIVTSNTIDVGDTNKTSFRLRGEVTTNGGGTITFNDDEIVLKDGTNFYDEETSALSDVVTITLTGNVSFLNTLLYTIIKESSFINLFILDPIGFKVKAYDNLPDLEQKELFKDALTLTFSILQPDFLNKKINLVSLSKLSSQNKVDWSEKFVEDSEEITNSVDGLAKRNRLTYANGIGDSFFDSSIEFLADETNYIEMDYAGSPDKQDYAVYNVYFREGDNKRNESEGLRIVYVNGIYARFEPLRWINLQANFYENYFISLNKPRKMTAEFNLKKLDVLKFKPLDLVYLDKFNSIFIVQEIIEFIPGEFTKVKMIRYGSN